MNSPALSLADARARVEQDRQRAEQERRAAAERREAEQRAEEERQAAAREALRLAAEEIWRLAHPGRVALHSPRESVRRAG